MSDTNEARAREMGWKPQEEFKGDPAKWVDADEYVRRGEEFLPIIKANNKRLEEKVEALMLQNQRLTQTVAEGRQSMNEFIEFSERELKTRLEEQKKRLKSELRVANREDNDDLAGELEERLEETDQALAKLKDKPVQKTVQEQNTPPVDPGFADWKANNPWYGGSSEEDREKTIDAEAIAAAVAATGKKGKAFYDAVDAKLAKLYPPQRRPDTTEEGRPSGGSGSTSSSDKGFNALPAEAKAYARQQTSKFVGANKLFKTEAEWFAHYAKQYNTEAA